MKTEGKVLRFLLDDGRGRAHSVREMARQIKADYKIVYMASRKLMKSGLVEKTGGEKDAKIRLSGKFSGEVFEAEMQRGNDALKNKDLAVVLDSIKDGIGTTNFTLVLFGSYAAGKQRKNSDIDMMFIIPDGCAGTEKKIEETISLLPLPIHHQVFTESQFRKMRNSREPTVVSEAVEHGIILHGTEQYYELIK